MSIKVVIAGPRGKMGSEVVKMMKADPHFEVVAYLDRNMKQSSTKIPTYSKGDICFQDVDADVLVDFTVPNASFNYMKMAIKSGVCVVSGTTGLTSSQINEVEQMAIESEIGCVIAPNFALGAVLMMHFAKIAAGYFPHVEIIDKHHDQKVDSPSGTAIKTAQLIQQTRKSFTQSHPDEYETIYGARGAQFDGMNIHSVRLPGHIAHHEVIFGGLGQTLSIKHDSLSRESFMAGLTLAINQVMDLHTFVYGLDNLLDHK